MALLPHQKLVGTGLDYETLPLWFAAESTIDYGTNIQALCVGDVGANVTLTGSTVNGLIPEIYSLDKIYKGVDDDQLAVIDRLNLQTPVKLSNVHVTSSSQWVPALRLNGLSNGSTITNIIVDPQGWSGVDAVVVGDCPDTHFEHSYVLGGVKGLDYGYYAKLKAKNLVVIGSDVTGLEGSGENGKVYNTLSLNHGSSDFHNLVTENCASSDATGNIHSASINDLIDFDNRNFQIKSDSPLHALGIGAHFEEQSQPTSLIAESGDYIISGSDVGLIAGQRAISCESADYTWSGSSIELVVTSRSVKANSGGYIYTGENLPLTINERSIAVLPGEYLLEGQDVEFIQNTNSYSMTVESGNYLLTGNDVGLVVGERSISAENGDYTVTGHDVALLSVRGLQINTGNFLVYGSDVDLKAQFGLVASPANYQILGTNISLRYTLDTVQVIVKLKARFLPFVSARFIDNNPTAKFI